MSRYRKKEKSNIKNFLRRSGRAAPLLVMLLLGTAALYLFLISTTIADGIAREREEHTIAKLNARVSAVEHELLTLQRSITLDLASARGFTERKQVSFILRKPIGRHTASNNDL